MNLELGCENTGKQVCPGQIHIENRGLISSDINMLLSVHTPWPEFYLWEYNLRKERNTDTHKIGDQDG